MIIQYQTRDGGKMWNSLPVANFDKKKESPPNDCSNNNTYRRISESKLLLKSL